MSARLAVGLCVVLRICAVPAPAQEVAKPLPAFRLLDTNRVERLQEELDEASAGGYAVAFGSPAYQRLVLRPRAEAEERAAYRVLEGKDAIEQALAQGYRALPGLVDTRAGRPAVIARKARETDRYESLLLHANRTGTLDREIGEARARGFCVIGMGSDDEGHWAILERPAERPVGDRAEAAVLLATSTQETLQKELSARAADGYHIVATSAWKEILVSLQRRAGEKPVGYRVLSTTRSGTLEREINAAAEQGFRFSPGTLHAVQKGAVPMLGRTGTEYTAIMEKRADDEPHRHYVIVGARRSSTLAREFEDAVGKGLSPVALTLGYSDQETLILFERVRQ